MKEEGSRVNDCEERRAKLAKWVNTYMYIVYVHYNVHVCQQYIHLCVYISYMYTNTKWSAHDECVSGPFVRSASPSPEREWEVRNSGWSGALQEKTHTHMYTYTHRIQPEAAHFFSAEKGVVFGRIVA